VGGGGLLSGSAISAKSRNPSIRVIGVEPALADDAYQSWRAGSIQSLQAAPKTIADGVRTTSISTRTFEVMFAHSLVDEIVTVTEDEIASAVRVAWTRLHIALEPTGALPLAAYLTGKLPAAASRA
jgi:threonine dehydratase